MEVTLKNAFYLSIKYSVHPYVAVYRYFCEVVQQNGYKIANCLLQKPTLTIFLSMVVLIFITIALAVSVIFMAGITCLVIFFIMVESLFALIWVFLLANVLAITVLTLMITHFIRINC